MDKQIDTPIKSIRKKCLECCCGSYKEVRSCPVIKCAIYPYRFGKRPTNAILDTKKKFYNKNPEPSRELS